MLETQDYDNRKMAVFEGKYMLQARVLSTKLQFNEYTQTDQMKMLIQVMASGPCKLWGSVPRALLQAQQEEGEHRRAEWFAMDTSREFLDENNGQEEPPPDPDLRGATIQFTATVTQSPDDVYFGFFKRPSKAKVISWQEG